MLSMYGMWGYSPAILLYHTLHTFLFRSAFFRLCFALSLSLFLYVLFILWVQLQLGVYLHSAGPHSLLCSPDANSPTMPNCAQPVYAHPFDLTTLQRYHLHPCVFVDCILDWDLCGFMSAQPSTSIIYVICLYCTQNDKIVFFLSVFFFRCSLFVFQLEFPYICFHFFSIGENNKWHYCNFIFAQF